MNGEDAIQNTGQIHKVWMMLLQGKSLKSRLARGVTWSTAGSVVCQGSSLVTAIVVARLVGMEAFGRFVLVQSTALMLQGVGGLGLGPATTRLVARLRSRDPQRTGRVIGFSLLFTLVSGCVLACLVLAMPVSVIRSTLRTDTLDGTMRMAGIIAFCEMLNRIQADVLIGLESFARMAGVYFVRGVLTLSLATLGAIAFGLPGAVAALAVASLFTCMVSQVIVRRECKGRGIALTFRGAGSEVGILGTSLFVTGSTLTLVVATWILCVCLARQANGLAEVAIFNAADRWRTAMLFLPSLLAQVSLPLFAHTLAQGHGPAYRRLLIGTSCTVLAATAIPAGILILLGPQVMAGYGDAFAQGKPVLVLLAVTCLPMSLCMVGNYGLLAAGKTATMLTIDVLRASIALSYCLLQTSFTAFDVAAATLFSYLLAAPLVGLALWRTVTSGAMQAQFQGALAGEGSS